MTRSSAYLTTSAYAAIHGVTRRTVQQWCLAGLLPGAECVGRDWMIPRDTPRPVDGRRNVAAV